MRYAGLTTLMLLLYIAPLWAQEKDVEADRPADAVSPTIATKHRAIIENGFEMYKDKTSTTYFHPVTFVRYGVTEKVELMMNITFQSEKAENLKTIGISPVNIGAKIKLVEPKNIIPEIGVLVISDIPTLSSPVYRNTFWAPKVRMLFENKLSPKVTVDYNAGVEWNGYDTNPDWIYATDFEYHPTHKSQMHFELFGTFKNHELPEHNIATDYAYYPRSNIKLDIGIGKGLVDRKKWFATMGFSFLL